MDIRNQERENGKKEERTYTREEGKQIMVKGEKEGDTSEGGESIPHDNY